MRGRLRAGFCLVPQPPALGGGRGEEEAGLEAEGDCVPGKGVIFPGLAEP